MKTYISRRDFLLIPILAGAAGTIEIRSLLLPNTPCPTRCEPKAREGLFALDLCPECGGWGRITCPACDGTGIWTEASEHAGLLQREAARAYGRCAWCSDRSRSNCITGNDLGDAECRSCKGSGIYVT